MPPFPSLLSVSDITNQLQQSFTLCLVQSQRSQYSAPGSNLKSDGIGMITETYLPTMFF